VSKIWNILLAVSVIGILTACNTVPVKHADRNTMDKFAGKWSGIVKGTPYYQHGSAYTYYCNPIEAKIRLEINDGVVDLYLDDQGGRSRTYINKDGFFKFVEKTNREMGGETADISPDYITFIVEGNLEKPGINGKFIAALEKDGDNGCKTDIRFSRSEELNNQAGKASQKDLKVIDNLPSGDRTVFQAGLLAFSSKDYELAFANWQSLAKKGYAESQYRIAKMYELAQGIGKDQKLATFWYLQSAEKGNPNAQYEIANRYYSGTGTLPDYRQAFIWYRRCLNNPRVVYPANRSCSLEYNQLSSRDNLRFSVKEAEREADNWQPRQEIQWLELK